MRKEQEGRYGEIPLPPRAVKEEAVKDLMERFAITADKAVALHSMLLWSLHKVREQQEGE